MEKRRKDLMDEFTRDANKRGNCLAKDISLIVLDGNITIIRNLIGDFKKLDNINYDSVFDLLNDHINKLEGIKEQVRETFK